LGALQVLAGEAACPQRFTSATAKPAATSAAKRFFQ
jgi:hypothetical protein